MLIRYGLLLLVGTLSACATVPDPNTSLERARVEYESIQTDPNVIQYAPAQLSRTETLLQEAQQAWAGNAPRERIEHLAYLTTQQAALARETAKLAVAEIRIAQINGEQAQAELDSRTRQAEEALHQAELAREEARIARESLETLQASQRERELALELERVAERERMLREELGATSTERGLVVTLSEVRFAMNQAELQGDNRSLDRLARLLQQHPERNIRIEGFTDNTGSDELNRKLSEQRAEAVRQALIEKGVDASRIEVEGFGKESPIASNDTATGRQQNRRVEVVILEAVTDMDAGSDAAGSNVTEGDDTAITDDDAGADDVRP